MPYVVLKTPNWFDPSHLRWIGHKPIGGSSFSRLIDERYTHLQQFPLVAMRVSMFSMLTNTPNVPFFKLAHWVSQLTHVTIQNYAKL